MRRADVAAQHGHGDAEELGEQPRAVDPRRVVELGRDALDAGQQQHEAEPEVQPRGDQADRGQRGAEAAQPRRARWPGPARPACRISLIVPGAAGAISHVHTIATTTVTMACGRKNTTRKNPMPRILLRRTMFTDDQRHRRRDQRVEDQQDAEVDQRATLDRGRRRSACSCAARRTGDADAVPVLERVLNGLDQRVDDQHGQEDHRGRQEQVARHPFRCAAATRGQWPRSPARPVRPAGPAPAAGTAASGAPTGSSSGSASRVRCGVRSWLAGQRRGQPCCDQ